MSGTSGATGKDGKQPDKTEDSKATCERDTSPTDVASLCSVSSLPEKNVAVKEIVKRVARKSRNHIPDDILLNESLNESIKLLPQNYNFEIHKTLWRIRTEVVKTVALQFPEGLLIYACIIADILSKYGKVEVLILGDVTYGACCIDDFTAGKLGAELLVHYGHSCLVPVNVTKIKVVYVFVEISFDCSHLVSTITQNFGFETHLALMGTIQFSSAIHNARSELEYLFPHIFIPQAKPLSAGKSKTYLFFFQKK